MTEEGRKAIEENRKYYDDLREKLERKMKHIAWCEGRDAAAELAVETWGSSSETARLIRALKSPYEEE